MKYEISVIMPVFNMAEFVDEALESVLTSASHFSHQIIVVNDGSTDQTAQALQKWKKHIHYIFQENEGPASARNAGLAVAQGKYIAFLDADDVWTSDHIQILLSLIKSTPKAGISLGYSQRFFSSSTVRKKFGDPVLMPSVGCALFQKSVFDKVGKLNTEYFWHEDVDWYLRAKELEIPMVITKQVVKYYRVHDHNSTRQLRPTDKKLLHVLAKSLARRQNKTLPSFNEFEV